MIDKMDKKGERKTGHFFAPILTPAGVRMDSLPKHPSYQLHKTTYTPAATDTEDKKYWVTTVSFMQRDHAVKSINL